MSSTGSDETLVLGTSSISSCIIICSIVPFYSPTRIRSLAQVSLLPYVAKFQKIELRGQRQVQNCTRLLAYPCVCVFPSQSQKFFNTSVGSLMIAITTTFQKPSGWGSWSTTAVNRTCVTGTRPRASPGRRLSCWSLCWRQSGPFVSEAIAGGLLLTFPLLYLPYFCGCCIPKAIFPLGPAGKD